MRDRGLLRLAGLVGVVCCAATAAPAAAQGWPAKPVRVIVPYGVGSTPDIVARLLAPRLGDAWGHTMVVENIVGANGILGTEALLKAPRDGHTLAMLASNHAVSPSLYPKMTFDVVRDVAPISALGAVTFVLVANPSLPVKSVRELIALARARPGELGFGSAGNGSPGHLAGQLLRSMSGADILHVPYKAIVQALTDVIGGHLALAMSPSAAALPHVQAGRLRALGVTSGERMAAAPEIPTLAESGLRGYDFTIWVGLVGAAGLAPDLVTRLNADFNRAIGAPDVRARLEPQGVRVLGTTPEQFAAMIAADTARFARLVRESGAKLD